MSTVVCCNQRAAGELQDMSSATVRACLASARNEKKKKGNLGNTEENLRQNYGKPKKNNGKLRNNSGQPRKN